MIGGSLDHTKSFVRCEWKWIMLCLEKFGFGTKFRKWVDILPKSSISAIQTNGFLSSFFPITRSIKQGCPIACLLYVIQAEPMACSTRKCNTIQGIDLPMSMMHTFLRQMKTRYLVCLKFSGCMNQHQVQKWTNLNAGLFYWIIETYKQIKWTSTYVKTLGVHHGYNIDLDDIWRNKINKIKSWNSRDLTVHGNVLLIKAYVHSANSYELKARDIPNKYRDEITSIVNDFLWNCKRPLVSRTTITLDINKVGIKYSNCRRYLSSINN